MLFVRHCSRSEPQYLANCVKLLDGLERLHIYKKLAWLNELPADEAEYVFRACCGSPAWARLMAGSRPFPMLEQMFARAKELWLSLPLPEKRIAFGGGSLMSDTDKWHVIESRLARLLER
jgi:hypothetical protein